MIKILARSILAIAFIWLFAYIFIFLSMPSAGRDIFHYSLEKSKKYGLLVTESTAGIPNIKLSSNCTINIDKVWIERSDITSLTWYLSIEHTPGKEFGYNVKINDSRCRGTHSETDSALDVDLLATQFQQSSIPYVNGSVYFWGVQFLEKGFVLNIHLRGTNNFYKMAINLR